VIARAIVASAFVVGGCFEPVYTNGIPCSEANTCPTGEQCYSNHTCHFEQPGECDVVAQTNCPLGEKCGMASTLAMKTRCMADGPLQVDDACDDGADRCAHGLGCLFGVCRRFCSGAPDECGMDATCTTNGVWSWCTQRCDPIEQDCEAIAGFAQACYVRTDGPAECYIPAAQHAIGETCMYLDDCVAGAGCDGLDRVCRAYCDLAAPSCAPPATCMKTNLSNRWGVCR